MDTSKKKATMGWIIDQKLLDRQMTRKQFCDLYEIPIYRINRIARGQGIHKVDRNRIFRLLGIDNGAEQGSGEKRKTEKNRPSKVNRTPLGWEIKRRLADLQMTQRQFCEKYDIPTGRLSEIVTGKRLAREYRQRVTEILGIDEREFQSEDRY